MQECTTNNITSLAEEIKEPNWSFKRLDSDFVIQKINDALGKHVASLDRKYLKNTAQKTSFSIKNFFSKCDQIRIFLNGKLHLLCSEMPSIVG